VPSFHNITHVLFMIIGIRVFPKQRVPQVPGGLSIDKSNPWGFFDGPSQDSSIVSGVGAL
jgi:hypothetical protein